jgi:hypothetical protein
MVSEVARERRYERQERSIRDAHAAVHVNIRPTLAILASIP